MWLVERLVLNIHVMFIGELTLTFGCLTANSIFFTLIHRLHLVTKVWECVAVCREDIREDPKGKIVGMLVRI